MNPLLEAPYRRSRVEMQKIAQRNCAATVRELRILTVVDTFSRTAQPQPRSQLSREDVVATLERVRRSVGVTKVIRVDQGSEFISRYMNLWA